MPLAVLGPLLPRSVTRPAQRRLLSILLLDPGATMDRDLLIERFWPDPPPSARNALHVHVNGLRSVLPEGAITTESTGYRAEPAGLDRLEFERLATECRRVTGPRDRRSLADQALALWRGAPYPDLADDDFGWPTIAHLSELRLELEEHRLGALVDLGRTRDVIAPLRTLAAEHPTAEEIRRLLMLALYREGRQAEALREYRSLRRHLGEHLGIEPGPALRALEERILLQDPALGSAGTIAIPHNLPTIATSFVGRDEDADALREAVRAHPLVTIVGGPGFGKTRLATEVARTALRDHPDGVWFASLAEAAGPREVMAAISGAMPEPIEAGTPGELGRHLAGRRSLLVLDNCEQVLDPCRTFADAVGRAGGILKILATSRRPLGAGAEVPWRLAPLGVPEGPVDDPASSPSVQLFVDRARAVDRSFVPSAASLADIADLSRRLAGIPLAIELAARWVPALPLTEISAMLDPVAAPGMAPGRSLRSAIEWSLALLPAEDRALVEDLAVFRGSFDLDDAHAVCSPTAPRAPFAAATARLVDASLVIAMRDGGGIRYRMLEPIREFLREGRRSDRLPTEEAFARHFLTMAGGLGGDPYRTVVDLRLLDAAIDNVRAALEIGIDRGWSSEVAAAIVPVSGYLHQRVLAGESREWLTRVAGSDLAPADRVGVLRALGSANQILGRLEESIGHFEEATAIAEMIGDEPASARCLLSLAGALSARGRWDDAHDAASTALSLVTPTGNPSAIATAEFYLGEALADGGAWPEPAAHFAEAARRFEEAGEGGRASYALARLARAAILNGDPASARRAMVRAVDLAQASTSDYRVAVAEGALALVEAIDGEPAVTARLLESARRHLEPNRPDGVVEVGLPAITALVRLGQLDEAARLAARVREFVSSIEPALSVPWEQAIDGWLSAIDPPVQAVESAPTVAGLLDDALSTLSASLQD